MPPKPLALDGLMADVPRPARFTARVQVSRLLLLLASALVISLFCLWAALDLRDLNALTVRGRTALAQITGRHIVRSRDTSLYYVEYTFSADGTQVNDEYEVGQTEYERPQASATMLVTFLPSHPQTNRRGAVTQGRVLEKGELWMLEGFGVCALLGALLTVREFFLRRRLAFLRDGSLAEGTVTDCDKGSRLGFAVRYEFKVDGWSSPAIHGFRFSHEPVEVGSSVAVLYDPANVSRNVPYRMMTGVALARPRQ